MFEIGTTDHWWEIAKRYPILSNLYYTLKPLGYAHMITLIETFKPKTILEVGHGKGSFLFKIFGNDVEMWGLDDEVKDSLVLEKDLEWSRKEYPKVNFVKGLLGNNVKELPSNYFDLVCSVSVIEHIPEEQLPCVFEETSRILKPGGIVSHSYDVYYAQNIKAVFDAFENAKLDWLKPKDTMNVFWEKWMGRFDYRMLNTLFKKIVFENPMEVVEKYMWYVERNKRIAPINILTILTAAKKPLNKLETNKVEDIIKPSNILLENLNNSNSSKFITPEQFIDFTYSKKKHFDLFIKNNYDEELFFKKIDPTYCDIKAYQHLLLYSFIKQNIEKGSKILEIGNEISPILNIFKNDYEYWKVDNIEELNNVSNNVDKNVFKVVNEHIENTNGKVLNNYFDFVYSCSTYGHELSENAEKYKNVIKDISFILKPEGYYLFSIILMSKEPIGWVPEVISHYFEDKNMINDFVPLFKISLDPELFFLSEKYYYDHWYPYIKLPYDTFGKPFSYNLLWKKGKD